MSDESSKKNIDLDKLVSTLIKEKEQRDTSVTPDVDRREEAAAPDGAKSTDAESQESFSTTEPFEDDEHHRSSRRFGRRRKKADRHRDEAFEEEWADWNLKPIGYVNPDESESVDEPEQVADEATASDISVEDTDIVEKSPASVDEFPSITPVAETITLPIPAVVQSSAEQATKVIPTVDSVSREATEMAAAPEEPDEEQLPDQLSLEEMVRVEDVEAPADATVEDGLLPEERFQQSRMEKVREFAFTGVEEEVNEPEEEPEESLDEEPLIEDFTNYDDSRAVGLELQYRVGTSLLTLVVTAVLAGVSLALTLLTLLIGESPITSIGYISAQAFTLLLIAVLNYTSLVRGLSGLFSMKANADSLPSLLLLLSVFGVAAHLGNPDGDLLPLWSTMAGIPMVFACLMQYIRAKRVRRNFDFVSYEGEKYTADLITEEKPLREIGHQVSVDGQARIAYFHRSRFLSGFLMSSYEDDAGDDFCRWQAPISFIVSLAVSGSMLAAGYVEGFWAWMYTFFILLSLVCVPVSLVVQSILAQCGRYMLRHGGFAVGWKAIKSFGKPDALIVDAADLFPDESMLLHGIKTFAGMQIDDAILYASSLAIRSGGPLSLIFRRIIENKTELLCDVENLVYEQGMGLSGWVSGNRIFLGNRRLLSNHGVDVPSSDYEARYAKEGRRLVYLSMNGNLSAMFVVSYMPNEEIRMALADLCRAKITILVRSCDQNITAADLCHWFELDEYYVEVLPAAAGRMYDQMATQVADESEALLASNGHILGTAGSLSACRSILVKTRLALIVCTVCAALGLTMGFIWCISNMAMSVVFALLLMLLTTGLSVLIPRLRRI